ncbi:TetR/AcrR family transcriptional regulator [Amycolatopsis endophytica]|uniref:AcrR family transcriptional regulator n=1 Tax=Amycolatopsis endophytica TaxID=860233 RepID=A0A853BB21_9PSEU|nr:TetR/AcrR family transcriptional regulator [Amycolatopsis endophytica]NYI91942.1 AcrR family transcriptional regulator [Amycolatopsis endophytica]
MTTRRTGLREEKKQATRQALREAALRLALGSGPDDVRVDDIAEAAGVSPRTYNNYFSSREEAIVAAVTGEREARVAAAVIARPDSVRLADAVIEAVVEQYTSAGDPGRDAMTLITTHPALREAFVRTTTAIEHPLADAITQRGIDPDTAGVLAAGVTAAVRVALERWLRPAPAAHGLVVPAGALPDLLRGALETLAPALEAAEART